MKNTLAGSGMDGKVGDMQRVKIGDIVAISFADHCEDSDGPPLYFSVYGRVSAQAGTWIRVDSWEPMDPEDDDRTNTKSFTILKKVIIEMHKLKAVKT